MNILAQSVIQAIVDTHHFIDEIEQSFVAYSQQEAVIPPVAELLMEKGETHIKYGYMKHQPYFVIKVASGFYDNPKIGRSSSQGLVLLFNKNTGEPEVLLQDGGILTNYRTAYAGAIAAKYLAPKHCQTIGIIGSGIQAYLQATVIAAQTSCKNIRLWGRSADSAAQCVARLRQTGIHAEYCHSVSELATNSQIIVTTTPSDKPLLTSAQVNGSKLIIAVGADTAEKQELDTDILVQARLVTDSRSQAEQRGELSHLLKTQPNALKRTVELGEIIAGESTLNAEFTGITVVDLTGIATQDLAIAQAVYERWL